MRRINETDIREAGLVPVGHSSNKTGVQLFEHLSKKYENIEISINHEPRKSQGEWKTYKFVGLDKNDCLLKEITIKPLTEEEKEIIKEQFKNGDFSAFGKEREKIISDKIIKFNAADICNMDDSYCATIRVED